MRPTGQSVPLRGSEPTWSPEETRWDIDQLTVVWPSSNPQAVAIDPGCGHGQTWQMTTKSREYLFGSTVKAKAEGAAEARKNADPLACEAWNARMLGFRGPAPPSPATGDALNVGYGYLEVKCLCNTHQILDIVRRPKITPVHELERYMRCKECPAVRRYAFKRAN